ncbi:uncharacterized protein Z518_04406 [Rhinocladiella mackenziei CBS 650.93]|uniref:SGNH hydrolase-type esterase domain-containing protein n=1 Tax=Rhinocladiella mackenziei CBS 650.93 TaxID=1442369 RepID=A0A0D2JBE9_9EURO|nr:uncharacterized protein Z518_04406 [Rhinocladiella mackenziei CBS 650.93]KIX06430.1 hypothetical protein Z518_04406 [Rhinocladiella mackenziei CBS 650.93]
MWTGEGFAVPLDADVSSRNGLLDVRSPDTSTSARPNPIKTGYVAFGDSFVAGIGTGTTERSGCRRGEFSYPNHIYWRQRPEVFRLLNAFVLWWGGPKFSGNCDKTVQNVIGILNGNQLYPALFQALQQTVIKSGRTDFKLYMTGYPAFFNVDTTYCNDVAFHYWFPHHRITPIEGTLPFLDTALRLKLNNLVQSLNSFLSGLVNDFNNQYLSNPPVEIGVDDAVTSANSTLPDPDTCDPEAADIYDMMTCMTTKAVSVDGSSEQGVFPNDTAIIADGEFDAVEAPW